MSRRRSGKSAQLWAWEFLRRNPTYREVYKKLAALTSEELGLLGALAMGAAEEVVLDVVRKLDIGFFDTSRMMGFKPDQKTVGEFMDQTQGLREAMKESGLELPVDRKFLLGTYCLAAWYDPDDEWDNQDVVDMWLYQNDVYLGLEREPFADDRPSFLEVQGETEHFLPLRPAKQTVRQQVDKRRRGVPKLEVHAMQSAFRGADQRVFMREETVEHSLAASEVSVVFDVSLPLEYQLDRVKSFLKQHQQDLQKSSFFPSPPAHADRFGNYSQYLQILDMLDVGMSHLDIAKELDGVMSINEWRHDPKANQLVKVQKVVGRSKPGASINELTQSVRKKIERALSLRDHGYRALAFNF